GRNMMLCVNTTTRREFLAGTASPLLAAGDTRPNIVFILSDDHHYQCVGAAGNPNIRTPNLDRLASRGVFFTNGQISTPQCCPSRGILLSGLETYQSGLISNGQTSFRPGHPPTVPEKLRASGYDTLLIGKWHIRNQPRECGFSRAPLWLRGGSSRYQDPQLAHGLDSKPEQTPGHITDLFTDAAVDVVRNAKQPFFLWLAYNAPHTPWYAAPRYRELYEGRSPETLAPPAHPKSAKPFDWVTYYSVISHLDEGIGRVIGEIDARRLWDNTYVFFLGDNGFMCGTKDWNGKVVPWEESIRVPYLAAGGKVRRGVRSGAAVTSIDLPATWLDLAGVTASYKLAGRSIAPVLKAGRRDPEAGFSVWADGRPEALAVGTAVEPYRLVRTGTHKLIVWESGRQALYDLRQDPGENRDLSAERASAETLSRLRGLLAARMKETDDPAAGWLVRRS
ncbi:MAG TPA: sulfatase-like hydrolase/transferase, partial [Bryobacteraceae bacterium]|nr:sulfatase-like hydrolase/transferase [Bryobacteraceae bacterium]